MSAETSDFPSIQIFNTLTRTKETFQTVEPGKVGMYLCGPTVYKEAHIGHMVGPVIFDTVKRYLSYVGYEVNWVVNITDVDDKLIAEANRRGLSMAQVATEMTMDYCSNLLELGVNQISAMPRATENMEEIISFIGELIASDFAYEADGDVFFDVLKDAEYGKLTNRSADDQQGEGGTAAGKKRSAADFALWKSAKTNEPSWESPWGPGRPGWHIECSAMSRRILGKTFDIHGGGLDLTFPHHENEIAQSECCHGVPMANYWMHNGLMRKEKGTGKLGGKADRAQESEATVDDKISRSKGAGGLRDLISSQTGERIRFFLLRSHYRSTIEFGDKGLAEAGTALEKFYTFFERYQRVTGLSFYPIVGLGSDGQSLDPRDFITTLSGGRIETGDSDFLKKVESLRNDFIQSMNNDFDTNGGVSALFGLLSELNKFADSQKLEEAASRCETNVAEFSRGVETLRELSGILGLFSKPVRKADEGSDEGVVDAVMQLVISLRNDARASKNWDLADKIRDGLSEAGVVLEDRKGETGWKVN
ncbi:MAG: cysteine--tRNA ligase [Planctomycetota bacterium]|nr:cysteine--tRNA ligase [Planctomycetota bacterium]